MYGQTQRSGGEIPSAAKADIEDINTIILQTTQQLMKLRVAIQSEKAGPHKTELESLIQQAERDLQKKSTYLVQTLIDQPTTTDSYTLPPLSTQVQSRSQNSFNANYTQSFSNSQTRDRQKQNSAPIPSVARYSNSSLTKAPEFMTVKDRMRIDREQALLRHPPSTEQERTLLSSKYGIKTRKRPKSRSVGKRNGGYIYHEPTSKPIGAVPTMIRNNPHLRVQESDINHFGTGSFANDSMGTSTYDPKNVSFSALSLSQRGYLTNPRELTISLGIHSAPALVARQAQTHHKSELYCTVDAPDGTKMIRPKRSLPNAVASYGGVLDLVTPSTPVSAVGSLPDHTYKMRVNDAMVKKAQQELQTSQTDINTGYDQEDSDIERPPPTREDGIDQKSTTPLGSLVEDPTVNDPREYDTLMDEYSLHHILIKKGCTLTHTPEFISFARAYAAEWIQINAAFVQIEEWSIENGLDLLLVDGKKVAELARRDDFVLGGNEVPLGRSAHTDQNQQRYNLLSDRQILSCIVHLDDVMAILKEPGHRFKTGDVKNKAATAIQSVVRMFLQRTKYKRSSPKGEYATRIQRKWHQYRDRVKFLEIMQEVEREREEHFQELQETMKLDWTELQQGRRVHIHIASLGFDERIRQALNRPPSSETSVLLKDLYQVHENTFLSDLLDLKDPLVDVILILPCQISQEILLYLMKLLVAGSANSESPLTMKSIESRLRILVPETTAHFPSHFSLSFLLLLSSKTLQKLKQYTTGRNALLFSTFPNRYDAIISTLLSIPLYSSPPAIAAAFGSKSGAKRLFATADVNTIPSIYDIYDPLLLPASIGRLISRSVWNRRVVVKIDDECRGRGHCVVDLNEIVMTLLKQLDMEEEDLIVSPAVVALANVEEEKEQEERELIRIRRAQETLISEGDAEAAEEPQPINDQEFPRANRDYVEKVKTNQDAFEESLLPLIQSALGLTDAIRINDDRNEEVVDDDDVDVSDINFEAIPTNPSIVTFSSRCPPNWREFLLSLSSFGGVVELCVGDDKIIGHPVVEIEIMGDGSVSFCFAGDKLFATDFCSVGLSIPSQSVAMGALVSASTAIGEVCFSKGMLGRITLNYLVFEDEWSGTRLCGVSVHPCPSVSGTIFRWLEYVTGAEMTVDSDKQQWNVLVNSSAAGRLGKTHLEERAYIVVDPFCSREICLISHGDFFSECRGHGITLDVGLKKGVMFSVGGDLKRGLFGFGICGKGMDETATLAAHTLSTIGLKVLQNQVLVGMIKEKNSRAGRKKAESLMAMRLERREDESRQERKLMEKSEIVSIYFALEKLLQKRKEEGK